ncbi:hypothetical protein MTO96_034481 [Rhipicephalus appendiculatus]
MVAGTAVDVVQKLQLLLSISTSTGMTATAGKLVTAVARPYGHFTWLPGEIAQHGTQHLEISFTSCPTLLAPWNVCPTATLVLEAGACRNFRRRVLKTHDN